MDKPTPYGELSALLLGVRRIVIAQTREISPGLFRKALEAIQDRQDQA